MMSTAEPDLSWLLSPVDAAEFFNSYFEQRPLVLQRGEPHRYAGLLSASEVETIAFTWSVLVAPGLFHMAKGGKTLSPTPTDEKGRLRMGEVIARYHQGFTIILNQLERRWPTVASLCASVESTFQSTAPVQLRSLWANSYLSPPNSQGFLPHYDDHDVIVLQLEGSKEWRIYEALAESPFESRGPIPSEILGDAVYKVDLRPGDLMYLPRGHPHEAATGHEHSLHMTIALWPLTWLDVITEIARTQTPLRRAARVPTREDPRGSEWWRGMSAAVSVLADEGEIEKVMTRDRQNYLTKSMPPASDHLEQINHLSAVSLDTPLQKRHGQAYELVRHASELRLCARGGSMAYPHELEETLQFLIATEEFCARSLPLPHHDDGKLRLVRELIARGFLRAVAIRTYAHSAPVDCVSAMR